jgi:hypothetical protein
MSDFETHPLGTVAALEAENKQLRDDLSASQTRAYELAVAIMGGEDAPGLADSIGTAYFVEAIRKERAAQREAEFGAARNIQHWRHECGKLHAQIGRYRDGVAALGQIAALPPRVTQ